MNKFKLIFKGVMLWITAFVSGFFITGIDSICDNGYFIQFLVVTIILYYICYKTISKEELETLTLHKWFNKLIGN